MDLFNTAKEFAKYAPAVSSRPSCPFYDRFNIESNEFDLTKISGSQHVVSESNSTVSASSESDLQNVSCHTMKTETSSHFQNFRMTTQVKKINRKSISYKDARFSIAPNGLYCSLNAKENPIFAVTLYIEIPSKGIDDEVLCLKTDLATRALLAFFYPWSEIQCTWVKDLQTRYDMSKETFSAKPKFTTLSLCHDHKAVLVLSKDAGELLRHKNVGLLRTLAVVLQMEPQELLVMVGEDNPDIGPEVDAEERSGTPV